VFSVFCFDDGEGCVFVPFGEVGYGGVDAAEGEVEFLGELVGGVVFVGGGFGPGLEDFAGALAGSLPEVVVGFYCFGFVGEVGEEVV